MYIGTSVYSLPRSLISISHISISQDSFKADLQQKESSPSVLISNLKTYSNTLPHCLWKSPSLGMRLSWTQKSILCRTIYTVTWLSPLRKMASATMEVPFTSRRPIMSVYNRICLSQPARTSTGSTSHFFPLSLHSRHLFVSLFLLGAWVGERIITCELSLFVQFQLPENLNPKLPNSWTNSQTLFFLI